MSSEENAVSASTPPSTQPVTQPVPSSSQSSDIADREAAVAALKTQEQSLKVQIEALQANYDRTLKTQAQSLQGDLSRLVRQNLKELEGRKQSLQIEIEQLERRQERIQAEMRTSFAGVSQDLAIRVQGFKEYLVGSLQDLVTAADQLELTPPPASQPSPPANQRATGQKASRQRATGQRATSQRDRPRSAQARQRPSEADPFGDFDNFGDFDDFENNDTAAQAPVGFASQRFKDETQQVLDLLDQYRLRPDYYGPVWQLRRTFEPVHADRLRDWFLTQGGRGAIKSMGSRLQNVLIAAAATSVLRAIYGDRIRLLVLANTPERLGEWRRGLQDCLGVSRVDFGTNRGIMLFEAPEPMAQRADRLVEMGYLPLLLVDEAEDKISLSLLQFPLWLVFAPDPLNPTPDYDFY